MSINTNPNLFTTNSFMEIYGSSQVSDTFQSKLSGKCVVKSRNGSIYEGDFVDGKEHGKGLLKYSDGSTYEGDFLDGKEHGKGLLKYADGSRYEGEFFYGKQHGKGFYQYKDGSSYDGNFVDGKKHGKGLLKHADGSSYEGDFAEGKKHGKGVYIYKHKAYRYEGDFFHGEMHGKGVFQTKDGSRYEGDFLGGKMHGKGFNQYEDGSSYEGDFVNLLPHGKGVRKDKDGTIYNGNFVNGKMHGKGRITFKDGNTFEGDFEFDVLRKTNIILSLTSGEQMRINLDKDFDKMDPVLFMRIANFPDQPAKSVIELYETLATEYENNKAFIKKLVVISQNESESFNPYKNILEIFLNTKPSKTADLKIYFNHLHRYHTDSWLLKVSTDLKSRFIKIVAKHKNTWAKDVASVKKELREEVGISGQTTKKTIIPSLNKLPANDKEVLPSISAATKKKRKKEKSVEPVASSSHVVDAPDNTTNVSVAPKKKRKKEKTIEPVASSSNAVDVPDIGANIKKLDNKTFFEEFLACKKGDFGTYRDELRRRIEGVAVSDLLPFCGNIFEVGMELVRSGNFKRARLLAETLSSRENHYTNMLAEKVIENVLQSKKLDKFATARKALNLVLDKDKYGSLIEAAKQSKEAVDAKRESFASQRRATLVEIKKPKELEIESRELLRRNSISELKPNQARGHNPLSEPEVIREYKKKIKDNIQLISSAHSYKDVKEILESYKMTLLRTSGSHETWGYNGFEYLGTLTLATSLHTKELGIKILAQAVYLKEKKDEVNRKLS